MTRPFVLTADDFGMSAGVSRTILRLLQAGRISATGAMVNCPAFALFAGALRDFEGRADLGLHLNLTAGGPLGRMPALAPMGELPPLGRLARAAALSAAARTEIAAEIGRQFDRFEALIGRPPDFVDGHQHAHVLPGVRGAALDAVARRYPAGSVYVRDPFDTPGRILARGVAAGKALAIAGLSLGLGRQARRRGIPVNDTFAGVSPFDPARDFGADMRRFMMARGERHLVMVHPGEADDSELARLDSVLATRPLEAAYLGGPAFGEMLAELGLRPARFAEASASPLAGEAVAGGD